MPEVSASQVSVDDGRGFGQAPGRSSRRLARSVGLSRIRRRAGSGADPLLPPRPAPRGCRAAGAAAGRPVPHRAHRGPPGGRPRDGVLAEFRTFTGSAAGCPVSAVSSGIGGPSVAIAVEELAPLGVRTIVRVGTCGALQPGIGLGDLVIATAAVRSEATPDSYLPAPFPRSPIATWSRRWSRRRGRRACPTTPGSCAASTASTPRSRPVPCRCGPHSSRNSRCGSGPGCSAATWSRPRCSSCPIIK